jgi:uracil-DNA glycosylase family 4
MKKDSLKVVERDIVQCDACRRLRTYCLGVAQTKRKAYLDQTYWGRPVAGFGDPEAWMWIVGLAPAAHGANRTGRVFTGDRSGDFLYAALHRAGLANQPTSVWRDDGLALTGVFISAAARCAPPDNKPLPIELKACETFLDREWALLKRKRVILALGRIAWDAALSLAVRNGVAPPSPRPQFGHGAEAALGPVTMIGSYHVSQQNTFTGKLTDRMFDAVLLRATELNHGGTETRRGRRST